MLTALLPQQILFIFTIKSSSFTFSFRDGCFSCTYFPFCCQTCAIQNCSHTTERLCRWDVFYLCCSKQGKDTKILNYWDATVIQLLLSPLLHFYNNVGLFNLNTAAAQTTVLRLPRHLVCWTMFSNISFFERNIQHKHILHMFLVITSHK